MVREPLAGQEGFVTTREEIFDFADELGTDEGIVVFDGLEDAFVGVPERTPASRRRPSSACS